MPQKTQSALVQMLAGNPNRRTKDQLQKRIKNERILAVDDKKLKDTPEWLDDYAKEVYKATVDTFKETTLYNDADVTTIARYSDLMSELRWCNEQLNTLGRTTEDGEPSRFISLKLRIEAELDKLAEKLGLMPTARAGLALNLKDDLKSKAKSEAESLDEEYFG